MPSPIEHLSLALHSRYGVCLEVDRPTTYLARLKKAREENPEFSELSFLVSPTNPNGEIWIVKKGIPINEQGSS
jgi:hypothetical protein